MLEASSDRPTPPWARSRIGGCRAPWAGSDPQGLAFGGVGIRARSRSTTSERKLLGDLPLDQGVRRRRRPRTEAVSTTSRPAIASSSRPAGRDCRIIEAMTTIGGTRATSGRGQEAQARQGPAPDRREPRPRPERRLSQAERGDGEAQSARLSESVSCPIAAGNGRMRRAGRRGSPSPLVEEASRQRMERPEHRQGRDRRIPLARRPARLRGLSPRIRATGRLGDARSRAG